MSDQKTYARLLEISQYIQKNFRLEAVLEMVLKVIGEELDYRYGAAILLAREDGTFFGVFAEPERNKHWKVYSCLHSEQIMQLLRYIPNLRTEAYVPDIFQLPVPAYQEKDKPLFRSFFAVPIGDASYSDGAICLFDKKRPLEISEKKRSILKVYSQLIALAVRNIRLFGNTKEILEEQQLLLDVTRALSFCSSIDQVLNTCFYYVETVLENPNVSVHMCDPLRQTFIQVKFNPRGVWELRIRKKNLELPFNDLLLWKAVRSRKPLLIYDIMQNPDVSGKVCKKLGVQGLLIVPLAATGEVLGVLVVAILDQIQRYSEKQMRLLQFIADNTAAALSSVFRMEQLEDIILERTAELREKNKVLERVVSELRRISYQNELILNSAGEGIYGLNLDGEFTFLNPAAAKMLGYEVNELIGVHHDKILPPSSKKNSLMDRIRNMENPEDIAQVTEDIYVHKDGTCFPVEYVISPLREYEKIVGAVVLFKDITERKKTEEIIRKTDKLSAVGELAAGIAHEIRNPLTTLRGFIQLLQRGECTQAKLEVMLSELDRINFIVSELLVLSRPQAAKFQKCDLRKIVGSVLALINPRALANKVSIEIRCTSPLPSISCEENQLKQMLINILMNSIEAMPQGGFIRIKLSRQHPDAVSIRVIDTGCGIAKDRLHKLGEPFYTTKEKGTGLGLMVAFQIVKNHRGTIRIFSKEKRGTKVEITLPIA